MMLYNHSDDQNCDNLNNASLAIRFGYALPSVVGGQISAAVEDLDMIMMKMIDGRG